MSNHNQYYRDNDFSPTLSADYTLLMQVGAALFSYAVIGQNKLLALGENININELSEPADGNEFLLSDYKQCVIGLPQNGFTFIPVSLFRPDRVADFARFLDVKANEKVFSQPLDAENQVIYKVNESIATVIANKFDATKTVFGAKGWIMAAAESNSPDQAIYLNINNDTVELLNFKEGKLRFYNSFEFKNEDELVYFTSFVTEELQLQPQSTTVILSGDVEANDKNESRLAEFFHKVELSDLKTIELPEQVSSHTVLSLTALLLCGSSEAH